ncbi:MAG: TolC family protein [Deltaproteobacteria bacterium]|nr:TolC family protein [Deltaproteobacteria bacterium]MBI3017172.1 TolC family protein [Deltaproteobacteria bacterium]
MNVRRKIKYGLCVVLVGFSFQNLSAEEKPLKLKELIEEALEHNPSKKAAQYDAESQKAQIGPSGSYDDPMIAFAAKDYPVDTLSPRRFGMTGNEVSVAQKVPFPGKLTKMRSATRKEYESKDSNFNQTQLQVIRDVKQAYYELFLAYKKHEIVVEQKKLIRQLIAVVRSRYSVGKVPQAELLNFQIEGGKLTGELLESEREVKVKMANLGYVLGREGGKLIGKPEELTKTHFNLKKFTQTQVLQKALERNFGLKASQAMRDAASEKLTYAKLSYLPDFELMAGYTFREPSPGDPGTDFVSGKVGMSVPLWFLTKQSELVKSASAQKAKAEAELQTERTRLIQEVRNNYSELIQTQQSLDLYENALLPLSRQAVASGKSAYLTGRMEYLSLLNIINERFQTEYAYNNALVNYETKISEFEVLMGESLDGRGE